MRKMVMSERLGRADFVAFVNVEHLGRNAARRPEQRLFFDASAQSMDIGGAAADDRRRPSGRPLAMRTAKTKASAAAGHDAY